METDFSSGKMPKPRVLLAVALAVTVSYHLGKHNAQSERGKEPEKVWVLAVGLKFKSVADRDQLLETWRKLAVHTRANEPGTLSYKWLVADDDPTNVLVYERYVTKEAYSGPHRSSDPFFAFKDAQKTVDLEITGQSYYETPDGFM